MLVQSFYIIILSYWLYIYCIYQYIYIKYIIYILGTIIILLYMCVGNVVHLTKPWCDGGMFENELFNGIKVCGR